MKRKAQSDSEDEAQLSAASSEPKHKSSKKAATKMKKNEPSPNAGSPVNKANTSQNISQGAVHTSSEGDKYVDLGKKRRATVRAFKGISLLDIREFYGTDEKPGKKGISLTLEQWDVLKANGDTIDHLFSELIQSKK